MIIEEKDFRLVPISDTSSSFDLSFKKIVNKGKVGEREEWGSPIYGIDLGSAIERIIMHRAAAKYPEDTVISLKTYLIEFKKMWKEIRDLCHKKEPAIDKT